MLHTNHGYKGGHGNFLMEIKKILIEYKVEKDLFVPTTYNVLLRPSATNMLFLEYSVCMYPGLQIEGGGMG